MKLNINPTQAVLIADLIAADKSKSLDPVRETLEHLLTKGTKAAKPAAAPRQGNGIGGGKTKNPVHGAIQAELRANSKGEICYRTGVKLAPKDAVYLELDMRTGTYTSDTNVPEKDSKGWFPFSRASADYERACHRKAQASADAAPKVAAPKAVKAKAPKAVKAAPAKPAKKVASKEVAAKLAADAGKKAKKVVVEPVYEERDETVSASMTRYAKAAKRGVKGDDRRSRAAEVKASIGARR